MRLISQDGEIDVPYEHGSLCIGFIKGEEHIIDTISYYNYSSQKGTKLAEYSSKTKALKVMEMLRNAYIGIPLVMQNVDLTEEVINELKSMDKKGLQIVNTDTQPRVDFISNCYFQFPKDEEVEV